MTNAVSIKNLKKSYKDSWSPALDGLSLEIPAHKIFGLLGPNGAGKTTTISIISGIINADSGGANVFGHDCSNQSVALKKTIGLVPQQYALFGNLTGRQNINYIGSLYGLSNQAIKDKGAFLLEQMGLQQHADKQVKKYSGGMKRRINIIASLLHNPKLIILDEPTAGVDVHSRALILDFLKRKNEEGTTILYTSHLLDEAEKLCDNIAIIDQGKLVVEGDTQQVIKETPNCNNLEDVFLHFTGNAMRD